MPAPPPDRLRDQIRFLVEIDKVKQITRQTVLIDGSRRENDAEHSWHLAVMAMLLAEYADEPVDVAQVIRMVLIHDLVEIDAGDTFCYDEAGNRDKREREIKAAERIFALLPADQAREVRDLWDEFEARETPEARFAASIDRLQPILHNVRTGGHAWREHGVGPDRVLSRNAIIADSSSILWDYTRGLIDQAIDAGGFPDPPAADTADPE